MSQRSVIDTKCIANPIWCFYRYLEKWKQYCPKESTLTNSSGQHKYLLNSGINLQCHTLKVDARFFRLLANSLRSVEACAAFVEPSVVCSVN